MSAWNEQNPQDVRDIELHREAVIDWFGTDICESEIYDWEKEDDDEDAG